MLKAAVSDNADKFREVKAAEGLFDDEVIYVSTQGNRIGLDGGRIVVTTTDKQETVSLFRWRRCARSMCLETYPYPRHSLRVAGRPECR